MIVKVLRKDIKILHGGIAQLGERYTGSVEVMGSSPTVSTFDDCGNPENGFPLFL